MWGFYVYTASVCQEMNLQSTTRIIQEGEDSVRAYGMWMTTLAEYHQSWVHRKRNSSSSHTTTEHGMEIARLEGALKFADYCREFCESTNVPSVQLLLPQTTTTCGINRRASLRSGRLVFHRINDTTALPPPLSSRSKNVTLTSSLHSTMRCSEALGAKRKIYLETSQGPRGKMTFIYGTGKNPKKGK